MNYQCVLLLVHNCVFFCFIIWNGIASVFFRCSGLQKCFLPASLLSKAGLDTCILMMKRDLFDEGREDGQGDQGKLTAECEAFHLHTIVQASLYRPSSNAWPTAKSWRQQHPGWTFWNCLSYLKIIFLQSRSPEASRHPSPKYIIESIIKKKLVFFQL